MIMSKFDFAEELKDKGIIVNCLHPAGLMPAKMVFEYLKTVLSSIEQGAEAVEQLAVSSKTGKYYNVMNPDKVIPQAYNKEARKLLRELSMNLKGISQ